MSSFQRGDVTPEFLRSALSYDPLTGDLRWLPRSDVPRRVNVRCIGKIAGKLNKRGYRTVVIHGSGFLAHRIAWAITHGEWPSSDIDHIDGNPSNNSIANLRLATKSQNQINRPVQKNNSAGHKGVSWHSAARKWAATLVFRGKRTHLGVFSTREEAANAYRRAAEETGFSDRVAII